MRTVNLGQEIKYFHLRSDNSRKNVSVRICKFQEPLDSSCRVCFSVLLGLFYCKIMVVLVGIFIIVCVLRKPFSTTFRRENYFSPKG